MSRGRPAEIALIGLGCRFAGASDAGTFFENILAGKDCTREVPCDRWNPATFCDPVSEAGDRVPTCRGGYLDSPLAFDAAEHGIMPRTVNGGEPEQFLVLEAATAAVADAGLTLSGLAGTRAEVVIGRGNYFNRGNLTRLQHGRMIAQALALLDALHPDWTPEEREAIAADLRASLPPFEAATIPGQLTNATAGRLAHRFDLSGASFVVDAASASSLVALDLAMNALQRRRADLAIAGGVYLEADVDFPLVFRQLNALSLSGTARPFGAGADGMLPGEGAGVVVLKRRRDAERDGDRIYALVQSVGIASDGHSKGLAAPSARGHARALRRAYRRAAIDPATVALVEGHGLGVPAADRAELRAMNAVFPAPRDGHRYLGAVSSMIGHAMPAAGIAGLIKTALALYHRVLPPTLHAENPHPLLGRPGMGWRLSTKARPWTHSNPDVPRRAGVSAFGFAGVNAHAVLEEHTPSADGELAGALRTWDTEAVLLSAADRGGLIERVRELLDWLKKSRRETLKDVAYTLNCIHRHPSEGTRLGVVASSLAELADRLSIVPSKLSDPACALIRDARGIYFWNEPLCHAGAKTLAFVFPGEGSQYPGMFADLCIQFPIVRRLFDTADRIARDVGEAIAPSDHLFGPSEGRDENFWSPATAVNVVLNAQWAMYQLLSRLELRPDAVLGHSSGELLALAAAGVFPADRSLEEKLGRLGSIFRGFESSGDLPEARLVAVAADRHRVETLCRAAGARNAAIAMDNCPHQVVVAVPPSELDLIVGRLREENILFENLPFSRAYHTASFSPVVGPIADFFTDMALSAPRVPIYSCASGRRMPEDPCAIRALAVDQWTRTVSFRETIEAMYADGLRLFVDVGARGNLAGFVEDILRGKPAFAVAANLPRRSGLAQLNHLVAATFAQGAQLQVDYLYARRRPRVVDWNAPEPSARTTVELAIGFPELEFSDDLVARMRSRAHTEPTVSHAGHSGAPQGILNSLQSGHEHPKRNGTSRHESASAETAAIVSGSEPPLRSHQEPLPRLDPHAPARNRLREFEEARIEPLGDVDDEMLSFQKTMRMFLQTQQEIMTAFLEGSTGEHDSTDTLSPFLPEGKHGLDSHPDPSFISPCAAALNGMTHGHSSISRVREPGSRVISSPVPGPWSGEVRRLVPGLEIETLIVLEGDQDPIAHHHTLGGRKVSALEPSLKGLPVLPFAVMAEMTAQAAALAASGGLVLSGLTQVRAHKWVRYEDEPVFLEIRAQRVPSSGDERFWVGIFNRGPLGKTEAPRPVFEAIVIFASAAPEPPQAAGWSLSSARPSKFTARSVYDEQWLFHGPVFQAISHVGNLGRDGIEGTIRVLPWEGLVKKGQPARFHTDLIVVDNFTQILGCWGLDYLSEGDVVFPLSMEELEIYGDRPSEGTDVACRITIMDLQRHRLRVEAEIIRPDGSVWMRIRDWEDWRFHWPGRYRDVMRQPRDFWLGEELSLGGGATKAVVAAKAVWLEPPADMGRPVWRDVLEQIELGPKERAALIASVNNEQRRTHKLWGRIAAKEAARRLWHEAGAAPIYPADLTVVADQQGRPALFSLARGADSAEAAISIAHCDGVAVALAADDPRARVGIDVEAIADRPEGFEPAALSPREQALLDRLPASNRSEWITRFWCAKEAAAKASGLGLSGNPEACEITEVDEGSGIMQVKLGPDLARALAGRGQDSLCVVSARRNDYAWAWTLVEGADS
jgi:acyl transferase domain-containing protein/phosphopantetheinyl transferase